MTDTTNYCVACETTDKGAERHTCRPQVSDTLASTTTKATAADADCIPGTPGHEHCTRLVRDTPTNTLHLSQHPPLAYSQGFKDGMQTERARIVRIIDPLYQAWLSRHPCSTDTAWHVKNYMHDLRHAIGDTDA